MTTRDDVQSFSALSALDTFLAAIRRLESGSYDGKYDAVNRISGALGAYQIMPGNWSWWTQKWGVPGADWRDKRAQDFVARKQFEEYYAKYRNWDLVAIAWFAGPGAADRARREGVGALGSVKDAMGTTVPGYVSTIRQHMANAPERYKQGKTISDLVNAGLPPVETVSDGAGPFTPDFVTADDQLMAFMEELARQRDTNITQQTQGPVDRRRALLTNLMQTMSNAVRAGAQRIGDSGFALADTPESGLVPEAAPVAQPPGVAAEEDDDA